MHTCARCLAPLVRDYSHSSCAAPPPVPASVRADNTTDSDRKKARAHCHICPLLLTCQCVLLVSLCVPSLRTPRAGRAGQTTRGHPGWPANPRARMGALHCSCAAARASCSTCACTQVATSTSRRRARGINVRGRGCTRVPGRGRKYRSSIHIMSYFFCRCFGYTLNRHDVVNKT